MLRSQCLALSFVLVGCGPNTAPVTAPDAVAPSVADASPRSREPGQDDVAAPVAEPGVALYQAIYGDGPATISPRIPSMAPIRTRL